MHPCRKTKRHRAASIDRPNLLAIHNPTDTPCANASCTTPQPAETHTAHPPGDAQAHTRMHIHSACATVGSTGKTMQPEEGQPCPAEAGRMAICATSTDATSRPIAGNWLTHSGMESQKRRKQRDQRAAGCRCKPGPAPAKAGGHQVSALPSELERWGNKQGAVLMVMCKLSTARNGPSSWSGPSIEPAAR